MSKVLFVLFVIIVIILLVVLLRLTHICTGGDLVKKDCGKLLFPWTRKCRLPSGKFCCMNCYMAELNWFSEIRSDKTFIDKKIIFKVSEEDIPKDDES